MQGSGGNGDRYTPEQIAAYKIDNERRVREAAARGDVFVDGMPLRVMIETTAECQLFCPSCPYPVPREKARSGGINLHMHQDVFDLVAPQAFPHAIAVNLSVVGEPLLSPYLDQAISHAREWQTKIEFITSGTELSDEVIEKVGPHTSAVVVSLDGATPRTFSRMRAGSDLAAVIRNIVAFDAWRRARAEGDHVPGLHLHPTLSRDNIEELPAILRLAHELRVDRVAASLMVAYSPNDVPKSLLRHRELTNAYLDAAAAVAAEFDVDVELPARFRDVSDDDEPEPISANSDPVLAPEVVRAINEAREAVRWSPQTPIHGRVTGCSPAELPDDGVSPMCKFLWNELYVTIDGQVAPCCIEGRPIVGNLHEEDLGGIWNGPKIQEMRRRLRDGNPMPCCRDCNHNAARGRGTYREDTMIRCSTDAP